MWGTATWALPDFTIFYASNCVDLAQIWVVGFVAWRGRPVDFGAGCRREWYEVFFENFDKNLD